MEFTGHAYWNVTSIGCGPVVVTGRIGSDRHILEMLFEVWAQAFGSQKRIDQDSKWDKSK